MKYNITLTKKGTLNIKLDGVCIFRGNGYKHAEVMGCGNDSYAYFEAVWDYINGRTAIDEEDIDEVVVQLIELGKASYIVD